VLRGVSAAASAVGAGLKGLLDLPGDVAGSVGGALEDLRYVCVSDLQRGGAVGAAVFPRACCGEFSGVYHTDRVLWPCTASTEELCDAASYVKTAGLSVSLTQQQQWNAYISMRSGPSCRVWPLRYVRCLEPCSAPCAAARAVGTMLQMQCQQSLMTRAQPLLLQSP
jgi:hypothetical protein